MTRAGKAALKIEVARHPAIVRATFILEQNGRTNVNRAPLAVVNAAAENLNRAFALACDVAMHDNARVVILIVVNRCKRNGFPLCYIQLAAVVASVPREEHRGVAIEYDLGARVRDNPS